MNDMKQAIVPKSDQLNADDLISGPITILISGVEITGGKEQPVSISFDGDYGKPYKPCKSMCRVMVTAWGPDSKKYIGRTMTLYRDEKVKWGGMEVGGIRISHMSDIPEALTMALTVTRANKKPFTVKPMASGAKTDRPAALSDGAHPVVPDSRGIDAAAPTCDPALLIKAREWAECGTNQYSSFWAGLTAEQRKAIGTARHTEYKEIAAKVPA